jgi:dTDP-4-dehydrorhamnose 3,5-epimerase-like enzyme
MALSPAPIARISDELYSPADEEVLRWNDPTLEIDWGIDDPILSARQETERSK